MSLRPEEQRIRGGRGQPKWTDYAFRHDSLRCDAFRPVENFKEMLQMSRQDTLDLLEGLAGAGSYDVVIVDTGAIEEERAQAVLNRCGVLLWVLKNDQASIRKNRTLARLYCKSALRHAARTGEQEPIRHERLYRSRG
ncbi:hypothetical protein ACFTAO_06025 [Paenibacillus rhizoplanae]